MGGGTYRVATSPRSTDVTALLHRWGRGEQTALAELMPLVYSELRGLADRSMRRERSDHTLEPTALVHEAYLRLAGGKPPALVDRRHFYALAARLMRRILVDHARGTRAERRGGGAFKVPIEELDAAPELATPAPALDLLALDEALSELAEFDSRKARIIELRFFGGLEIKETAALLELSVPTVVTDCRLARAWLAARVEERRAG
jgi:RNA polymerase sigma factor (TIGR02999 family)